MIKINKLKKLKWLLVLGLTLLLLTTFISCGGDLVDPKLRDKENPDERPEEVDPVEGSGSNTSHMMIKSEVAIV
ncbi:hypothetical protein IIC38_04870 [candidate division KSB1 bacterium]|nr:hypothetical protein [candidate division KSB1 bacterium]